MRVEDHPSVFNTYWVEDNMGYVQKKKNFNKEVKAMERLIMFKNSKKNIYIYIFFKDTKAVIITLIQHKY